MENKGPEPVTSPPPDLPECQWTAVNGTMNPHKCPLTTNARPPAHPSYGWMRGRDDTTKTSTTKTTTRDVWSPTLFSFHPSAPLGLQYALNSWPIPRSTGNFKKLISQSHTSTHFPAGRGVERGWRVNGGEGGAGMASMGADESSSSSMTIATHSKSMQCRVTEERESASQWRNQRLLMQRRTLRSTLHKCCVLFTIGWNSEGLMKEKIKEMRKCKQNHKSFKSWKYNYPLSIDLIQMYYLFDPIMSLTWSRLKTVIVPIDSLPWE